MQRIGRGALDSRLDVFGDGDAEVAEGTLVARSSTGEAPLGQLSAAPPPAHPCPCHRRNVGFSVASSGAYPLKQPPLIYS